MWGNRLGWILSAGLIAAVGGLIIVLEMSNTISPPTALTRQGENLEAIRLPIDPGSVVPASRPANAGPFYRKLIEHVGAHGDAYEAPIEPSHRAKIQPAMDLLIEAAGCQSINLFADWPGEVVHYDRPGKRRAALEALRTAGRTAIQLGMMHQLEKQPDEARRHLEAAFALGARMFEERVVYDQVQIGYELMISSVEAMARLADQSGDGARAISLRRFASETETYYRQRVRPIWEAINTIDPAVSQRHAGDVFVLATESKERMWRTEAALKLGLIRRLSLRAGDQRGALRALRRIADDPQEHAAVRAAAAAGRDLTIEEFRMLGG